jgi:hypothetical protein
MFTAKPKGTPKPQQRARSKSTPVQNAPRPALDRLRSSWKVVVLVILALGVGGWWSYFHVILANPMVATGDWTVVPEQTDMDLTAVVVQSVPNGLVFQLRTSEGAKELVFQPFGRRVYRHVSQDIVYLAELERFGRLTLEKRILGGGGTQHAVLVRGLVPVQP